MINTHERLRILRDVLRHMYSIAQELREALYQSEAKSAETIKSKDYDIYNLALQLDKEKNINNRLTTENNILKRQLQEKIQIVEDQARYLDESKKTLEGLRVSFRELKEFSTNLDNMNLLKNKIDDYQKKEEALDAREQKIKSREEQLTVDKNALEQEKKTILQRKKEQDWPDMPPQSGERELNKRDASLEGGEAELNGKMPNGMGDGKDELYRGAEGYVGRSQGRRGADPGLGGSESERAYSACPQPERPAPGAGRESADIGSVGAVPKSGLGEAAVRSSRLSQRDYQTHTPPSPQRERAKGPGSGNQ